MANDQMRKTWTNGAESWVAHQGLMDELFVEITTAITDAAHLEADHSVLDVGCGTGTLLAAAASAGARVTGVDISPGMVQAASRRVTDAHVVLEDAQTADLRALPGAPFDRVVSRFGVMFFDDPVSAFSNIGSATSAGARLAFSCWRRFEENPMFTLGTSILLERMETPPTADPNAPGPMAFADADRLARVLAEAGWSDVSIEPLDATLDYGPDGVTRRLEVILGTSTGLRARAELESNMTAAHWDCLLDEVRDALRRTQGDAPTLTHPAAVWIVTATA